MKSLRTAIASGSLVLILGCGHTTAVSPAARHYLYAWTGSADTTQPDFMAVLDVTEPTDPTQRYGDLITTVPVPGLHNVPHHTEHEMPADHQFFANGFGSGQSWIFDMTDPVHPVIRQQFGDIDGYTHPHSFLRLPGGNVLATFQMRHQDGAMQPGGLVEMTPQGKVLKSSSANAPGIDPTTRVYSAGIVPSLDRIVTTTTDMHDDSPASAQLQIWRLSDLTLLHTIRLPNGPRGNEGELTAEPRLLADGKTVLVSTFNCGLYLMEGLGTETPSAKLVASFPMKAPTHCAIPVVSGHYYLVTVPAYSAVVSLDISDPAQPREVSRAVLDSGDVPHWISISPDQRRVVITGYGTMRNKIVIARFDPATGQIAVDHRFRELGASLPGYVMKGKSWPHGGNEDGVPHGAVFSRP